MIPVKSKTADKIIIHNYTDYSDLYILSLVSQVVEEGLISETKQGKQYCFATRFKNNIIVTCTKRQTTFTFRVVEE